MNLESKEYHFLWGLFVHTGYDYSSKKNSVNNRFDFIFNMINHIIYKNK